MQHQQNHQKLARERDSDFRQAGRQLEITLEACDSESIMSSYSSAMNISDEIAGQDECNAMQDQSKTIAKEIPKSPINLSLKSSPFFTFHGRGVDICEKDQELRRIERCETVISNNRNLWKNNNSIKYGNTECNVSNQQEYHSSRVCSQIYDKQNKHSGQINSFSSIQPKSSIFSSINSLSLRLIDSSKSLYNHTFLNRQRCRCDMHLTATQTCSQALKWIYKTYKPSEIQNMKAQYQSLLKMKDLYQPFKEQIDKDVLRTFTETALFQESSPLTQELKNVLYAFSVYDIQVGYVQGMNLIAATMLYHAEEYIAFWLTCMAFESLEMRDIFLTDLPGIQKHVFLIDFLMAKHTPYIHSIFVDNDIQISDLFSSWILSLGAAFIPLKYMMTLIDSLFRDGWSYFYRLILAYVLFHEDKIILSKQPEDVLVLLAGQSYSLERRNDLIQWDSILKSADRILFNENAITEILQQFEPEKPDSFLASSFQFEYHEEAKCTSIISYNSQKPSFFDSNSKIYQKSPFKHT